MGGASYRETPDKLSTLASFSACEKHTRLETAALLSEVLRGQPIKHNKTITKDGFKLNNLLTQIVPYIFGCFNSKKMSAHVHHKLLFILNSYRKVADTNTSDLEAFIDC